MMLDHNTLEWKSVTPGAELTKKHWTDAGWDLAIQDDFTAWPTEPQMVGTGVAVAIPTGYVGLVFIRSSLGRDGITMANGVGVIDADYRGEIMLPLVAWKQTTKLAKGTRVAQLVVVPCILSAMEVDSLSETERGSGGFGSTGN